ncbi:hypothetical protein BLSTO_04436 [Blastocystis sp. subtype 1]
MANQDFHRILKTVLEIITDKGSVGFVMRKGRTAYRSRYVINVIRADIELPSLESTLTTGNPFLGFPGRHSSNQPCAQCKLRRRVYDPWIKILLTTRTNTVNEYNLSRFTFLPVESAVSIDMMHMMHNLFDHFVPFLLGKSIDLMEEETAPDAVERLFSHYNMEKKVLLNDILQQGRVKRNTQFSRFIYQINVLASPLLKTFLVTERTQPKVKFFPSSRIHHCFRAKTQPFQRSRISAFGKVFKALDKRAGVYVAVKKTTLIANEETILSESKLLMMCNSPFIVRYCGVVRDGDELWVIIIFKRLTE